MTHQVEAIVLQVTPFKDYDRILTLFSPLGILKMFVRIRKKEYLHFSALTSPLTQAEWHYLSGRKELHRLTEGTILSQHLGLRERYETLLAADSCLQALLASQWQGKPAPKLYLLFRHFLDHLPKSATPQNCVTLFLIKILVHEGMLQLSAPQTSRRYGGEQYSPSSAPPGSIPFSEEEEALLVQLAHCRSLAQTDSYAIPEQFQTKISTIFKQIF